MIIQEVLQLRTGVTDYVRQFDDAALRTVPLEGLLSHLDQTGIKVTKDELGNILYRENGKRMDLGDSLYKDMPVFFLSRFIEQENESLQRIGSIFGKPVLEMSDEVLHQTAVDMFMMSPERYTVLVREQGLPIEDDKSWSYEFHDDSLMLLGVLEKRGKPLRAEYLRKTILKTDFGLGYMTNMFKAYFKDLTDEGRGGFFCGGVDGIHSTLHDVLSKQKKALDKHLTADASLKEKHIIQSPQLLVDQTIHLEVIPYEVAFTREGHLAVLCGSLDSNKEDYDSSQMLLQLYNIKEGKLIRSVQTDIYSRFDGAGGMVSNFQGSLTSGTDGILYVNGNSRFASNLEKLTDNEGNYQDALKLLSIKKILDYNVEVFSVVEADGVFYLAIQPRNFPKCYDNLLIATDGKKIIGQPIGYGPTNGGHTNSWDPTPTIAVHGNDFYFKAHGNIFCVDRSLTDEAIAQCVKVVGSEDRFSGVIPSNHCVSPKGVLYVVNQFDEEKAQSIQGFKKGEFVTHVYPENYPDGWACMRSMAISPEGILAYTSVFKHKIHLYRLDE